MGNRILTMQREVREIGRLRTGYTGTNGKPVRSPNWILTSKDRELLDRAAEDWGGEVVSWTPLGSKTQQWSLTTETPRLPAIMPPGDPLNQANELWSRGGVVRRCDGMTEEKSGKPCLCLAQFGPNWHQEDKKERCQPYSYLKAMLLNLPDIGTWMHVTKSFFAAGELAGQVDLIRAQVGFDAMVPIWLIIDPRERVADGKRTPYPVPVLKIRGAESGAALLSGHIPTLELAPPRERLAIGAGTVPALAAAVTLESARTAVDFRTLAAEATSAADIRPIWATANQRGVLDESLAAFLTAAAEDLGAPVKDEAKQETPPTARPEDTTPPSDQVVDAETEAEPDVDAVWFQVTAFAGKAPRKWSSDELEQRCIAYLGKSSDDINGWQAQRFLTALTSGEIQ